MIPLTRLNGDQVAINPDRIERADITPDVVLTMTDGSKFVISESLDELIDRIRLFRASVLALSHRLVFEGDADGESDNRLRVVRGAPGGAVIDRHEVHDHAVAVNSTRPVPLHAVADGESHGEGAGRPGPTGPSSAGHVPPAPDPAPVVPGPAE
jgi:flagellar protein FlbD